MPALAKDTPSQAESDARRAAENAALAPALAVAALAAAAEDPTIAERPSWAVNRAVEMIRPYTRRRRARKLAHAAIRHDLKERYPNEEIKLGLVRLADAEGSEAVRAVFIAARDRLTAESQS